MNLDHSNSIARIVFAAALLFFLLTSCTKFHYSVTSKGYNLVSKSTPPSNAKAALRFDIDTSLQTSGIVRINITNTGDRPILLHKKYGSLSLSDTILSVTPFTDDPNTDFSVHRTSTSSFQDVNSRSGLNPYPIGPSDLAVGRSSSMAMTESSGSTITKRTVGEIVMYPKQVLTVYIDDFITPMMNSSIEYRMTKADGSATKRIAKLDYATNDEYTIDQDFVVLDRYMSSLGEKSFSLHVLYSEMDGSNQRIGMTTYGIGEVFLVKRKIRLGN